MSQINVNTIKNKAGTGAPNFPSGATVTGVATATSFVGDGSAITGINASNISSGTVGAARLPSDLNTTGTAGGLTGTPAIDVGNITGTTATFSGNISVGGTITYDDVTSVDSVGIVTAREDLKVLRNFSTAGVSTFTGQLNASGNIAANGNIVGDNATNISGISSVTADYLEGRHGSLGQNVKAGAYTLVLADAGKYINNNSTTTAPANIFAAGDVVSIYNDSGSNITIAQGGGLTMYLSDGNATTGNRTIAQRCICTVMFLGATTAVISGGGLT